MTPSRRKFEAALKRIFPGSEIMLVSYKRLPKTVYEIYELEYEISGRRGGAFAKMVPENKNFDRSYDTEQEVRILRTVRNSGMVNVPGVLYSDFSNEIFGRNCFIMEKIFGTPMTQLIHGTDSQSEKMHCLNETMEYLHRIHSLDLEDFHFLPYIDYGTYSLNRLKNLIGIAEKISETTDAMLLYKMFDCLETRKPSVTDFALIHGEISPDDFIRTRDNEWYILDWDCACIGDRSWDVYWLFKSAPEKIYGIDEEIDSLVSVYENVSKHELKNKEFYKRCAAAIAYALGLHIVHNDPDNVNAGVIKENLGIMASRIENYLIK